MGYLDNSSITVDAILTIKGRELLARNDGSFDITQFALGDDEIDYTLFNESHPNGTQYAAEAIENMPLIEALPNGANMLQSKLITLNINTSAIPYISANYDETSGITIKKGQQVTVTPSTYNLLGANQAGVEAAGYIFTIIDSRLQDVFALSAQQEPTGETQGRLGGYGGTGNEMSPYSNVATIKAVGPGQSLRLRATTNNALFSVSTTSRSTSLIIEGATTGAKLTLPLTVTST